MSLSIHFIWVYGIEVVLGGAFIAGLAWAPVYPWKAGALRTPEINKLAQDEREVERKLLVECDAEISVPNADDKAHDYFIKKLFAAIDYAVKRHDWYEDQRSRVFQSALTLLSAVLAVIAVVSKAGTPLSDPYPLMLVFFAVGTSVALVRMLWLYSVELNADRPYRLVSDIAFWYFRYNLPSSSTALTPEGATAAARNVLNERKRFFDRITQHVPLAKSMREDLEQLFILHVLQRAKSESLSKMQWVLNYFLFFACVQVVLLVVLSVT